jgi:hypothetical protein
MRCLILSMLVFGIQIAFCTIWNVSLDGTHDFSSIQEAISVTENGDVIQVYPGVYQECLDTMGKSITIQSLYPSTHLDETIAQTIIHPAIVASCIVIHNGETVTINGLTLTNNEPVNLIPTFSFPYNQGICGGGIQASDLSSVSILNCVITNCIAGCGGIYFQGRSIYLSNTIIKNCIATDSGGGIYFEDDDGIVVAFDSVHPNSIYNNQPCDVTLRNIETPIHITFKMFSVMLQVPDQFFFKAFMCPDIQITVLNHYYNLVDQDLYVSPAGDDSNSGLSPSEPLRTIIYATKIIQSNEQNPRTIHLASGVYSILGNEQYFPVRLKSHVRLVGDANSPIWDSSNAGRAYLYIDNQYDIEVSNLKFIGDQEFDYESLGVGLSNNIKLSNLELDGNSNSMVGISCTFSHDVSMENILVHNSYVDDDENLAFNIWFSSNVVMNNCIVDNFLIEGNWADFMGYMIFESDITLRNSIISNSTAGSAYVFFYQNINEDQTQNQLDISNTLIINNCSVNWDAWSSNLVRITNIFNRTTLNNCTIANNYGEGSPIVIAGNVDVRNCISANPALYPDFGFYRPTDLVGAYSPTMTNSLVQNIVSIDASYADELHQSNILSNTNPLFVGVDSGLAHSDSEYYRLSAHSPCINAGLADTTGLNIPPMDLGGNFRIWDGAIDMGCYEYGSGIYVGDDDQVAPNQSPIVQVCSYPNPVYLNEMKSSAVFLEFKLPERTPKPPIIEIYNIKGQLIKSIEVNNSLNDMRIKTIGKDTYSNSGIPYSTVWNLKNDQNHEISSGLYLIRLNAGKYIAVNKMMVIK